MMIFPLNFYTSYNQFYIYDKNSNGDTASHNFWTDEAYKDRLAIEDGILGVGTECYGPVTGELIIVNTPNDIDADTSDHIVEGGIEIKSGTLQVLNCPDSTIELEINVKSGYYRARIYSKNLASVKGDEGDDFYKIEIWPDANMERTVLKRYVYPELN